MSPAKQFRNSACTFHIQTMETMDDLNISCSEMNGRLSQFEFFLITDGIGELCIDMQKYSLKQNSLYLLSPGQYRQFLQTDQMSGYFVQLPADFFSCIEPGMRYTHFDSGFSITGPWNAGKDNTELFSDIRDILQIILKEFERYQTLRTEIISAYFKIFTFFLSRFFTEDGILFSQDREKEIATTFMCLVKRDFKTKKMVTEYAADMFISTNYLNHVVKKISGFTASQHIQQCIILEAKRQVLAAPVKMKDVAYALGFDDYYYFSKFFKSKCGMNFSRFKKEIIHQGGI